VAGVYQRKDQNFADSLKNYQERMNADRSPLTLVAVRAGRAVNCRELIGLVSPKFRDMFRQQVSIILTA
jgi:hypothetical protein